MAGWGGKEVADSLGNENMSSKPAWGEREKEREREEKLREAFTFLWVSDRQIERKDRCSLLSFKLRETTGE